MATKKIAAAKQKAKPKSRFIKDGAIIATYQLTEPVDWAGEMVYELEFRPLKAGHLIEADRKKDNTEMDKMAHLIQLSTLADPWVIENLSIHDFIEAGKVLSDFLQKDLEN